MKKYRYIKVLVILSIIAFSGVSKAEVTITYMHRTVPLETEWAERVAAAFEEANPGVKVELISGGGGAGFFEKLSSLIASGLAPDIHYGSNDRLLPIHSGWILGLNELIEQDAAELDVDDYLPGVFRSYEVNGTVYGMPLNVFTQVVFWNRNMFDEYGLAPLTMDWDSDEWTWDDLISCSARLTEIGQDGAARQLGVSRATDLYLPDIAWMFGGDWFAPEAYETGKATKSTMTRAENVTAYEALQYLCMNYAAEGPNKGIDVVRGFQQGKLGMDWIGTWKVKQFIQETRTGGMSFDWSMAPVPLAQNRSNTRWVDALFIYKDTKYKEEAWEFVKFATGVEGQALWSELTGDIPARRSVLPIYVNKITEVMEMKEHVLVQFIDGGVSHSRRAVEESILGTGRIVNQNQRRWFNPIINGTSAVLTALERIQSELDAQLKALAN